METTFDKKYKGIFAEVMTELGRQHSAIEETIGKMVADIEAVAPSSGGERRRSQGSSPLMFVQAMYANVNGGRANIIKLLQQKADILRIQNDLAMKAERGESGNDDDFKRLAGALIKAAKTGGPIESVESDIPGIDHDQLVKLGDEAFEKDAGSKIMAGDEPPYVAVLTDGRVVLVNPKDGTAEELEEDPGVSIRISRKTGKVKSATWVETGDPVPIIEAEPEEDE
jgi:hypothetical protein